MAKEAYVRTLEPYFVKRDNEERFWWYSQVRNLLRNGGMESWGEGTVSPPDEWTFEGCGSIARESTIVKQCNYSAKIIAYDA